MCVYVYIYKYKYIYINIYIYMYMCVYKYISVCVCVCGSVFVHLSMCLPIDSCFSFILCFFVSLFVCLFVCLSIHVSLFMYLCIHVFIYIVCIYEYISIVSIPVPAASQHPCHRSRGRRRSACHPNAGTPDHMAGQNTCKSW